MPDEEASGLADSKALESSLGLTDHFRSFLSGVNSQTESVSGDRHVKKDPRKVARKYVGLAFVSSTELRLVFNWLCGSLLVVYD